jgi:OmpA-OmpF porin, OOP family
MRLRSRFLALAAAGLALAAPGCAQFQQQIEQPREWGRCALLGAVVGAGLGTPIGFVIANNVQGSNSPKSRVITGTLIGTGVGAVVGLVAGHFICDPVIQPPPPPPPPPTPPPPSPPPPAKEKLVLRGVHFDFDKYDIRPGDAAVLDEAATTLRANPNVIVQVNGYTDAIGSVDYNLRLSQRRAEAVADYLERQGVSRSVLITQGFGKTNFVATNDTPEGRAQNRRVELVPEQ